MAKTLIDHIRENPDMFPTDAARGFFAGDAQLGTVSDVPIPSPDAPSATPPAQPGATYAAPAPPAAPPAPEQSPAQAATQNVNDAIAAPVSLGGAGGPARTLTSEQQYQVRTPEQQRAYEAAQAGLKEAQGAQREEVVATGDQAMSRAEQSAAQDIALISHYRQLADANQREHDAAKREMETRMRDNQASRDLYLKQMSGEPLGSALNPNGAQRVMGAIALALGGFSAGVHGTPNQALAIIQAEVNADLEKRRERLLAGKAAVDLTDTQLRQSVAKLGSVDAGLASTRASLTEAVQLALRRQATLATGEGSQAASRELAAGMDTSIAKDNVAATAATGATVTERIKQSTGGVSGYELEKRKLDIIQRRMNILKAGGEVVKLAGGATARPEDVQRVNAAMEKGGVMKFEASVDTFKRALAANGGELPGPITRYLAGVGTRGAPGDLKTFLNQAWSNDRERAVAYALAGLASDSVYAVSGAQVNENEFGNKVKELGFNSWTSTKDVDRGIQRVRDRVDTRMRGLAAAGGSREAYDAWKQIRAGVDSDFQAGSQYTFKGTPAAP